MYKETVSLYMNFPKSKRKIFSREGLSFSACTSACDNTDRTAIPAVLFFIPQYRASLCVFFILLGFSGTYLLFQSNQTEGATMERRSFLVAGTATLAMALFDGVEPVYARGQVVDLPAPMTSGGKALLQCMKERRTNRKLDGADLRLEQLSTLLWTAWGVNRADGRHVVPTARNEQRVQVYAVLADGVWQYQPEKNAIKKVLDGDQRKRFDGSTLILLYAGPKDDIFAGMHVGSMYQNVGLYCASEGLANCVKYTKHDLLDKELPLPKNWTVYIAHSLGGHSA